MRMAVLRPILFFLALLAAFTARAGNLEVPLPGGEKIAVETYPATGDTRILWLPSDHGIAPRQRPTAEALAGMGFEVWMPDIHLALLLSPGRGSLKEVPDSLGQALIEAAAADGRRVVLMASGRTAPLALGAARAWQLDHPGEAGLLGAVLLHPNLYAETPQGGAEARYLPIASATNLPIYIFQPTLSASSWHLERLTELLERGGSNVTTQMLEEVSDGYNQRPDFTPVEEAMTRRLPGQVSQALWMLESYARPRVAAPLPERGALAQADAPRSRLLKPYAGEGATPPLVLKDLEDGEHALDALGGQVVLVNFWATWCPPCVKEIPSLQRLYARLRDRGFQVLAVDVGETAETVRTFAAPFEVTFPMLIDPDGVALKDWEVHGFPTSFVVDRAGHIRFAFFGALEWDDPEVVAQIESLLAE